MITQFSELVGNRNVITPLLRLLTAKLLPNFVLLGGELGTGKSTVSNLLGLSLTCESPNGAEPCLECNVCKANLGGLFTTGSTPYIKTYDMTRLKDDRAKMEEFLKTAFNVRGLGGISVYIVAELQALPAEMQEKFLEQLDRIDKSVYIIANCNPLHKVIETIRGRTIPYVFSPLSEEEARFLVTREFNKNSNTIVESRMTADIVKVANRNPRKISLLVKMIVDSNMTYTEFSDFVGVVPFPYLIRLLELIKTSTSEGLKYLEDTMSQYPLSQFIEGYLDFITKVYFYRKTKESPFFSEYDKSLINTWGEAFFNVVFTNALTLRRNTSEVDLLLNFIGLCERLAKAGVKPADTVKDQVETARINDTMNKTYSVTIEKGGTVSAGLDSFTDGLDHVRRLRNEASTKKSTDGS